MQVIVTPPDPTWPAAYAESSSQVVTVLGPNLLAIHHIGSTSIPGIHAKPIIDMLGVVTHLAAVDNYNPQLQSIGYVPRGELGIPGRRYFHRNNATGQRAHQIHIFEQGSPHIARHLAFRDFLRVHSAIAAAYSDLKRQLAVAHPNDIEAYVDGKDSFIKNVEARALRWAAMNSPIA